MLVFVELIFNDSVLYVCFYLCDLLNCCSDLFAADSNLKYPLYHCIFSDNVNVLAVFPMQIHPGIATVPSG